MLPVWAGQQFGTFAAALPLVDNPDGAGTFHRALGLADPATDAEFINHPGQFEPP